MQNDYLSQLHDIQLPEQVSWWPLAWGWWVLIIAVLLSLSFTIYWALKRHKLLAAKKQTLLELNQLAPKAEPLRTVKQVNNLLKRVCLAYADRETVASLTGTSWADWLNNQSTKAKIDAELLTLAYQGSCSVDQAESLVVQTREWIKHNIPHALKGASHV